MSLRFIRFNADGSVTISKIKAEKKINHGPIEASIGTYFVQ